MSLPHTLKVLASGRIAEVDYRGRATLAVCGWLIEVASGNPEPDSYEDTIRIIECGASLFAVDGDPEIGWVCDAGHHRYTYGSARQQAEERAEAFAEYRMAVAS